MKFLGQIINGSGVRADPAKVTVFAQNWLVLECNASTKKRKQGMGKYIPHLAEISRPLRELLNKKTARGLGISSKRRHLMTPPGLSLFDPTADAKVSADVSSYSLGAVLLQRKSDTDWRPHAYPRALSCEERRTDQKISYYNNKGV